MKPKIVHERERARKKKTLGRRAGNGGVLANRKKKSDGSKIQLFWIVVKSAKSFML